MPPYSSGYPRTNSPGFNGTSCGFVPGIPLPSIAGWLMPSLKPNGSVSVGRAWQSCRQMGVIPASVLIRRARSADSLFQLQLHPVEIPVSTTCTSSSAERLLPMFGGVLAESCNCSRARRHPLTELRRKTVERSLRNAEALEPRKRERHAYPGVARRTLRDARPRRRSRSAGASMLDPRRDRQFEG